MQIKTAVSTGQALVGNMGSKSHLNFAIVGTVAVLANAIVKLNHALGTEILICCNTWRDVKEFYVAKMVPFRCYSNVIEVNNQNLINK